MDIGMTQRIDDHFFSILLARWASIPWWPQTGRIREIAYSHKGYACALSNSPFLNFR